MTEFREIPGYPPRYIAGSDGRVYTTINTRCRPLPVPRPLSERTIWCGYRVVQLRLDGKNANRLAHVLIALAFLGPRNGLEVNHRDGDKTNNLPGNLEYVTRRENVNHAFNLGLRNHARGERIGRAALTADQIPAIRQDVAAVRANGRAPNGAMAALAKKYGVTASALDHIARGNCWRHIPDPDPDPEWYAREVAA